MIDYHRREALQGYDAALIIATMALLALGLLMVASASIVISGKLYHQPFHYTLKQAAFLGVGVVSALLVTQVDTRVWYRVSPGLLAIALGLLVLVLIPGVGHSVNGSMRWLRLGVVYFQVSELAKLFIVIYLSGYSVRHQEELKTKVIGFAKPMALLGVVALLLLQQPDFGATVVIIVTALGMLFLAGVRLWQFFVLMLGVLGVLGVLAVSSPYRLQRLTAFMQPWANQFDSGYQLTQSLIAFGRGGWFGVGLGESVQKLFYLPEAHTDFLVAVLAEELGLVGVLVVLALYAFVVGRGLAIARCAILKKQLFAGFMAYGLSLWLALQVAINLGVNAGVLPTKGLTLSLMSYGGSSMLISCIAMGLLVRIDHENRR